MSANDLAKCVTVNESNIPLPKRIQTGTKKSKGCAQLPELQKYIDTIIKASNDYDSEDTSVSDKEKFPKERTLGRNTVYKGYDNKIKHEKVQFDLNLNRRKIKNKPKTPFSEAVSSGTEIYNKYACEFEDPRNWKFDKKMGPSLEAENFLKKLYPNPYHLASVNEHKTVNSGSVFKKVDLREGTLFDVDISKVDTGTELVTEKPNELVNADTEIKPSERDHTRNNLPQVRNLENVSQPPPQTDNNIEDSKDSEVSNILTVQTSVKHLPRNKSSNSTSNISSRASSLESMNEIIQKESRANFRKRKSFKIKAMVTSKESLPKVSKSKSSTTKTRADGENPSDSDIGKLNLLNLSDSDDSAIKKLRQIKNSKDDLGNEESSDMCEEMFKSSDLNELLQIYNIMNKATESFLLLSSKNDFEKTEPEVTNTTEEKKFVEFLSTLKNSVSESLNLEEDTNPNTNPNSKSEEKNVNINTEIENSNSSRESSAEKTLKEEENKTSSKKKEKNVNINTEVENSNSSRESSAEKALQDENKASSKKKEKNVNINTEVENSNSSRESSAEKALKDENKASSKKKEKNVNINTEVENSNNSRESSAEKVLQDEDKKTSSKISVDVTLEEEKEQLKLKNNPEEQNLETEKTKNSLKNEDCGRDPVNEPKQNPDQTTEGVDSGSNHKVDEVLLFMYDCIKKFKGQEKSHEEKNNFGSEDKTQSKKTYKKLSKDVPANTKPDKPKPPPLSKKSSAHSPGEKNNLLIKSFPNAKEIHNKYSSMLNEKKPLTKIRYKRRSDTLTPQPEKKQVQAPPSVSGAATSAEASQAHCIPYPDSFATTDQNCLQTVESHNELGGFTEETLEPPLGSNKDMQIAKSILPLPLKIKKTKTSAYKTLKHVLETEEKLLANDCNLKESLFEAKTDEKKKDLILCNECLRENATSSAFSVVSSFKRQNSNFVICLNSFPRNMRKVAAVRPNIPLPISVSMTDIKCWNLRSLPCYSKSYLKKLSVSYETESHPRKLAYMFKQEALLTAYRAAVVYVARPVCMKVITSTSKPQEVFLMKISQCTIGKAIKKYEELNVPETSFLTQKSNFTLPSNNVNTEDKPIDTVIEAIEETEEKVFNLENHSAENLHKNCDSLHGSDSSILRNAELEKEIDKNKVHDLLLRTFNLQQKLHGYLHSMTYVQPSSFSCPLFQQEPFLDFGFFIQNKTDQDARTTESDTKPEGSLPVVHWYMQTPVGYVKSKTDEASTVKIQTTDQSTTYNPPEEEILNESNSDDKEEQEEDDASSVCSFKSSNDFSETNESPNETKEPPNRVANDVFIKNLFNKIDSLKQSFEEKTLENEEKNILLSDNPKEEENRLVEYESKVPAKVLRTVFRGRRSSTELTIGLKDVPMTKVSNISVEKTKFSQNHTKISICISKEKPEERKQNKTDLMHSEYSSYYFDNIRPSLSTCQTECSRLEDDISKSSQSPNDGSENGEDGEDDEDDYKSVGSSINNSDNEENSKPEEKKQTETAERSPPKTYTKHKFDFYRKMDLTFEGDKPNHKSISSCLSRYKELEPLKQALTEMQIRMRGIQRDAVLNSTDYYERALKLAKMSAGYCQSCGTRAVIPNDTFGYYKTLLHRRYTHHRRNKQFRTTITPNSSFYSFRSSMAEVGDRFCDLDIKHSSSYLLNRMAHSNRTVLRSSLHDMPVLFEKI